MPEPYLHLRRLIDLGFGFQPAPSNIDTDDICKADLSLLIAPGGATALLIHLGQAADILSDLLEFKGSERTSNRRLGVTLQLVRAEIRRLLQVATEHQMQEVVGS